MNSAENTAHEDLQASIVVIGGGGSGLAAAVAAAEKGVRNVTVLEKQEAPGGNTVFPGGILGVETPLQRRLGVDARGEDVFRRMMEYCHWKPDARIVRTLVDISGDNIRWLEEKGVKFTRLIIHFLNQVPNTYHATAGPENTGSVLVNSLVRSCEALGVRIINRCAATRIVKDDKGAVRGVEASAEGKKLTISSKGVIIATGGFAGNDELMEKYVPSYRPGEMFLRGLPHKGDGLLIAAEAGAATGGPIALEAEGPYFRWSDHLNITAKRSNTMWVNSRGLRFTDENAATFEEAANAIFEQPGKVCYVLLDGKIRQNIIASELSPFEQRALDLNTWRSEAEKAYREQAEEGRIMISRSWNEVAEWVGVDPLTLAQTVDEYNDCCDHGHDALFAKDRFYLQPLRTPPYYAIKCRIRFLVTHGGVRVNHRMEVLNEQDSPIPGLYCAGDITSGRVADTYPIFLSGLSLGFAIGSGRIAADSAARYISGA